MKRLLRSSFAFLVMSPVILITYIICSLFVGKEHAERLMGPILQFLTLQVLKILVPNIRTRDEFNIFTFKMRAKFVLWRPLWDVYVDYAKKDTWRLHISNCPFCEVLKRMRLQLLARSVCEADWLSAQITLINGRSREHPRLAQVLPPETAHISANKSSRELVSYG